MAVYFKEKRILSPEIADEETENFTVRFEVPITFLYLANPRAEIDDVFRCQLELKLPLEDHGAVFQAKSDIIAASTATITYLTVSGDWESLEYKKIHESQIKQLTDICSKHFDDFWHEYWCRVEAVHVDGPVRVTEVPPCCEFDVNMLLKDSMDWKEDSCVMTYRIPVGFLSHIIPDSEITDILHASVAIFVPYPETPDENKTEILRKAEAHIDYEAASYVGKNSVCVSISPEWLTKVIKMEKEDYDTDFWDCFYTHAAMKGKE